MRCAPQLTVLALLVGPLSHATALSAQQRAALVAGLRPDVVLVDNQHDATLESIGFQISAYVGRPFAADFAGLVELGVTAASHRAYYPPCTFPGCSGPSSLGGETAISLAPGLQWFTTAGTRRAAFTITPGAVWLVGRPAGTQAVLPKLGGRFELGWFLPHGPRVGVTVGTGWGGCTGTPPRWGVPVGLALELPQKDAAGRA